uniref:MHC class I-like antigen recognition-like domain-containing protein n=1 Tax=Labrus bergylta TaxID=56723 RepID=A0A3Q3H3R1_9LABR
MVDDIQVEYYDSNTKRVEPKQDWMNKVTEDKADYWERQTETAVFYQQGFKVNLDILKRLFNQTGGFHTHTHTLNTQTHTLNTHTCTHAHTHTQT